jgi:DNA repair protein RadD
LHIGYGVCPKCGYEFSLGLNINHDGSASEESILSGVIEESEYEVRSVDYNQHFKRNAPEGAPSTLRVEYRIGFNEFQSEWVCFEHTGFARQKAEAWWKKRSDLPVPDDVEEALEMAIMGKLAEPSEITIRSESGKKFDEIVGFVLGPKPDTIDEVIDEILEAEEQPVFGWPEGWGEDDEIPF